MILQVESVEITVAPMEEVASERNSEGSIVAGITTGPKNVTTPIVILSTVVLIVGLFRTRL